MVKQLASDTINILNCVAIKQRITVAGKPPPIQLLNPFNNIKFSGRMCGAWSWAADNIALGQ
jgi:hypothetical protein